MMNKTPKSTRRIHTKPPPKTAKEKHKKSVQFIQDTDNEASDDDDHAFVKFGLCNVGGRHELDIRKILLLDNKSTAEIFCNKRLVTRVWTTDESMIEKYNGRTIDTYQNYYVKGYGEVWFDE